MTPVQSRKPFWTNSGRDFIWSMLGEGRAEFSNDRKNVIFEFYELEKRLDEMIAALKLATPR